MDGQEQHQVKAVELRRKKWPTKLAKRLKALPSGRAGVVLVVVVIVVGTFGVYAWRQDARKNQCNGKADSKIYAEASSLLFSSKREQLGRVSNRITNMSGGERDANCLAILTTYHVLQGNVSKATYYNQKLKGAYKAGKGYVPALMNVSTPDQLQLQIMFLKNRDKELRTNMMVSD